VRARQHLRLPGPAGPAPATGRSAATSRPTPTHPSAPRSLPPALAAELSRAYGNRDVQRIIQTKLVVGPAGDHHEQEADRVAARVARATDSPGPGGQAPASQGPIPEQVRAPMEHAMGADFGDVRLHTDSRADRLNRALGATAFTLGRDIFFRRGEADFASRPGRGVLAHELTHVVQQQDSPGAEGVIQRKLWQLNPDRVYDDVLNVTATRSKGFPQIFIDDVSATEYEIGDDVLGNPTLVAVPPGFKMAAPPSTWSIAGTQSFTPPPAWAPPPVDPYWQSPGGTTTFSHSPGGTAYAPGAKGQGKYGHKSNRDAAGYRNPKQFAVSMLPLWQAAVRPVGQAPPPTSSKQQKVTWYQDPTRQYEVTSGLGGATTMITGYKQPGGTKSQVVLGHAVSAGTLFNTGGHTQDYATNYAHNQTTGVFHGLEHYIWSSQSAKYDPDYEPPRPDRGSGRTFWDPNAPNYTGGPWHSYNAVPPLTMINYIENKLAGVGLAQRDSDHQRAVIELALLKQNFTQGHADQLLSIIKAKGW
jgi:hypothetical protein